jgi:hypothetical protein
MFMNANKTLAKKVLFYANAALLLTFVAMIGSIMISYPYADHFSLGVQMTAHVSILIIAGLLKVSYVVRCCAQHELGLEVR